MDVKYIFQVIACKINRTISSHNYSTRNSSLQTFVNATLYHVNHYYEQKNNIRTIKRLRSVW